MLVYISQLLPTWLVIPFSSHSRFQIGIKQPQTKNGMISTPVYIIILISNMILFYIVKNNKTEKTSRRS